MNIALFSFVMCLIGWGLTTLAAFWIVRKPAQ